MEHTQEEALKRGEKPGGPGWGADPRPGTIYSWENGALQSAGVPAAPGNYLGFYEAIRDAITTGAPNPVSPEAALGVMTVLETAVQSSEQRRELPFHLARPGGD
jgi:predicted dehydrogenase